MNAPLPANEARRLQTLQNYHILDTPPETAFDRLITLAAHLFDVPIALVSMVDADRQWFKACFGVDMRQTSREISFCAYAILSNEVMVVPDAVLDARFSDNALVTGPPYIRFYAGAPLKTPSGQNLGSFCVLDTEPRQFSAQQQIMLADLAAVVVDELELRRIARDLRDSEAALRQSLNQNSQLSAAITNLTTGVVITDPSLPDNPISYVNAGFSSLTGYSAEEVVGRNCRFLQGPETDPQTVQEMREAIAERRPFRRVLLNYKQDGTPFMNAVSISPVLDEAGQLLSFVGLQNDVTKRMQTERELRESEERFRLLAENINDVFWMISSEGQYLYMSPAYDTIWGRSRDELMTNPWVWLEYVHPQDREGVTQAISRASGSREAFVKEFRIVHSDATVRWLKVRGFPIVDEEGQVFRVAGVSQDITRSKEAEEALRQAKATVEQANQVLEQRVQDRTADLAQSQIEILKRLARAAEYRDDDTGQHTQRVALTACGIAQALGLPTEQVELIKQAAPLHDVGKIAISDLILLKPGKLTVEEFETMKTHAPVGAVMLSDGHSEVVQMAERIAGAHHERWDGRGYPQGLSGEQIPLEGRILAVADVFDALTHERPYKKAWPIPEAVAEIARQSGTQFDPQVVEAFLKLSHEKL